MSSVGIIANPASGKDLRRIISSGITVTNAVKENAVQRMLLAMVALGVERALIMPDRSNLARRVLLPEGSHFRVRYNPEGPMVLEIRKSLQLASRRGYLRRSAAAVSAIQ